MVAITFFLLPLDGVHGCGQYCEQQEPYECLVSQQSLCRRDIGNDFQRKVQLPDLWNRHSCVYVFQHENLLAVRGLFPGTKRRRHEFP